MIGRSGVGASTSITAAQTSMLKSSSAVEKVSGEYWKCQSVSGRAAASSRMIFAPATAISRTSALDMRNTISRHAGLTAL